MSRTAKLFTNGRSQAVRLPREFRFKGEIVSIRKDPQTGDVILSDKSDSWDDLFRVLRELGPAPANYMNAIEDPLLEPEDIF